jgi:hypothetical protein
LEPFSRPPLIHAEHAERFLDTLCLLRLQRATILRVPMATPRKTSKRPPDADVLKAIQTVLSCMNDEPSPWRFHLARDEEDPKQNRLLADFVESVQQFEREDRTRICRIGKGWIAVSDVRLGLALGALLTLIGLVQSCRRVLRRLEGELDDPALTPEDRRARQQLQGEWAPPTLDEIRSFILEGWGIDIPVKAAPSTGGEPTCLHDLVHDFSLDDGASDAQDVRKAAAKIISRAADGRSENAILKAWSFYESAHYVAHGWLQHFHEDEAQRDASTVPGDLSDELDETERVNAIEAANVDGNGASIVRAENSEAWSRRVLEMMRGATPEHRRDLRRQLRHIEAEAVERTLLRAAWNPEMIMRTREGGMLVPRWAEALAIEMADHPRSETVQEYLIDLIRSLPDLRATENARRFAQILLGEERCNTVEVSAGDVPPSLP